MSVKDDLLAALEENRDTPISGQMIADKLGVSRNAVWKAINTLKADGYKIESCTNRGYQLAVDCDLLSSEAVQTYLDSKYSDLHIESFKEVDSTNNEGKRRLVNGLSENALIIAESQSMGRGRQGRSFYSPMSTGVYFSLVLQSEQNMPQDTPITAMAAVAVVAAIEKLTDNKPMIKWVNDVYLDNKKICGILTEAITDFETHMIESLVIGIGINVKTGDFPDDIDNVVGSLAASDLNRNQLIAQVVSNLMDMVNDIDNKSFLETYRSHNLVKDKKINYYRNGNIYQAIARGIDDLGGLIIETADGTTEVLNSGEISVRLAVD